MMRKLTTSVGSILAAGLLMTIPLIESRLGQLTIAKSESPSTAGLPREIFKPYYESADEPSLTLNTLLSKSPETVENTELIIDPKKNHKITAQVSPDGKVLLHSKTDHKHRQVAIHVITDEPTPNVLVGNIPPNQDLIIPTPPQARELHLYYLCGRMNDKSLRLLMRGSPFSLYTEKP